METINSTSLYGSTRNPLTSVEPKIVDKVLDDNDNNNTTISDKTVSILGAEYTIKHIKHNTDDYMINNNCDGYCDDVKKLIVILDLNTVRAYDEYTIEEKARIMKEIIRHEVIHAFLNESGLKDNTGIINNLGWSRNEEMIDWFAIQMPKIFKIYQEIGCI